MGGKKEERAMGGRERPMIKTGNRERGRRAKRSAGENRKHEETRNRRQNQIKAITGKGRKSREKAKRRG